MPVIVSPLHADDFPILNSHFDSPNGDLCQPVIPLYWSVHDTEPSPGRTARLKWSLAQQEHQLATDPTARVMKAVDQDSGEILAVARWHSYPKGWDTDTMLWREIDAGEGEKKGVEISGHSLPKGPGKDGEYEEFKADLHLAIWRWFAERRTETLKEPCWVLCTLKTRNGYRRQGAGSALIQWGCDKADADGLPAFLEAVPAAKGLYEKFGFREERLIKFNVRKWGHEEPVVLASMKREPKTAKHAKQD